MPFLFLGERERERERERETDRQTDTQTDRQTQRERERERERERQRQRDIETERQTERERQTDRQRQTETETDRQRQKQRQTDRQQREYMNNFILQGWAIRLRVTLLIRSMLNTPMGKRVYKHTQKYILRREFISILGPIRRNENKSTLGHANQLGKEIK